MQTDLETRTYINDLSCVIKRIAADNLICLYATGSLGFDDYELRRSDIDLLGITRHPLDPDDKVRLQQELDHASLKCPALGLDFAIVTRDVAKSPPRKPAFDFALATGHSWGLEWSHGDVEGEFILHLAICRQNGIPILGCSPQEIFGPIPHDWIVEELIDVLDWHLEHVGDSYHDPLGQFSTLNSCRALYYAKHKAFCSKTEGGSWVLSFMPNHPVVMAALAHRTGQRSDGLDKGSIEEFIQDVRDSIKCAAGTQQNKDYLNKSIPRTLPPAGATLIDNAR